ncbi:unnamed protein product [Prunus armeniaca]|uniref:Uncharacterized protein n=1 Tax=Prunus armeniaca TaxID=36596 RepID=A0A6J5XE27_PRUAR|nr:unnamed protein product [Prunus armeniaca]
MEQMEMTKYHLWSCNKFVDGATEEEKVNNLKEAIKMYVMDDGCEFGFGCITPKRRKRMVSRLGESKSVDECKVMMGRRLNGDGSLPHWSTHGDLYIGLKAKVPNDDGEGWRMIFECCPKSAADLSS